MAIRIRLGPTLAPEGTLKVPVTGELEAVVGPTIISPESPKSPSRLKSIQTVHLTVEELPPGVKV
jgi:hypothetical protein